MTRRRVFAASLVAIVSLAGMYLLRPERPLALAGQPQVSLLPSPQQGRQPAGFTVTGLTRITSGAYANRWLMADDGRLLAGDGSPFAPALHLLSDDFTSIVRSIEGDWDASAQGVCWDDSTNLAWVAASADRTLRAFDLESGREVVGERIMLDDLGLDRSANGLACSGDGLWMTLNVGRAAYLIRDGSIVNELKLAVDGRNFSNSPDHLHFYAGYLLYSLGGNGTPGSVRAINVKTGEDRLFAGPLAEAQAVEGIAVHAGHLFVASDGGYHQQADPPSNLVAAYPFTINRT